METEFELRTTCSNAMINYIVIVSLRSSWILSLSLHNDVYLIIATGIILHCNTEACLDIESLHDRLLEISG